MEYKKILLINTLSGYLHIFTSIITGIFSIRIIFNYLNAAEYGFWALLWSLFVYTVIADFGFGFSMEKFIPQYLITKEFEKIKQIINTVFLLFIGNGFAILLLILLTSKYLGIIFYFQSSDPSQVFKNAFVLSGTVIAINFPFSIFRQVLIGLHKRYIRDVVLSISNICTLVAIVLVVHFGGGLLGLVMVSSIIGLLSSLACFAISFIVIPNLKISFRYFDKNMLKTIFPFSKYAYILGFLENIRWFGAQWMIGIFMSITNVGIYHIAYRLPWYLLSFTIQFGQAIFPYASKIEAEADKEKTKQLIYKGTKFDMCFFIPAACCILFFNKFILTFWLGALNPEIFLLIPPLVFNICLIKIYNIAERTFIMHGGQRKFTFIMSAQILSFVIGGIFFLNLFGLRGLLWFTVFNTAVFYLFVIHFVIAKFCGMSYFNLFAKLIKPYIIPLTGFLVYLSLYVNIFDTNSLSMFFTANSIGLILYTFLFWTFTLDKSDKQMVFYMLRKAKNKI